MSNLKRVTSSSMTLFRQLPAPARVVVGIVAVLVVLYVWRLMVGLFVLAALAVGAVQLVRWLVR